MREFRQRFDFDFESENKRQLAGNIYLAKVTRVEPSLQAAFVEYGGNRYAVPYDHVTDRLKGYVGAFLALETAVLGVFVVAQASAMWGGHLYLAEVAGLTARPGPAAESAASRDATADAGGDV